MNTPSFSTASDPMSRFLRMYSDTLYKDVLQLQIKHLTAQKLRDAVFQESELLNESYHEELSEFIDRLNIDCKMNVSLWRHLTCKELVPIILGKALKHFNILDGDDVTDTTIDSWIIDNEELAFVLFWIPTLNFSYSASVYKDFRKAWGIRKGIFG